MLVALAAGGGGAASAAPPSRLRIEPVVWRFSKDYPGATLDSRLPVHTVYVKTHDGTDWMGEYDRSPSAIRGPGDLPWLVDGYRAQGIDVVAWFVPKGGNISAQIDMAEAVLDSGVSGLYADVEPWDGFCNTDCSALARSFWTELRQRRPDAYLGVIYDPRPWHWEDSGIHGWMSQADVALPMCYWETFHARTPWNSPTGCLQEAAKDLPAISAGRNLEFIPMIQGDSTPEKIVEAALVSEQLGARAVSIWRRGLVSGQAWNALASTLDLPVTPPEPPPSADPCLDDGCAFFGSDGLPWVMLGGVRFRLTVDLAAEAEDRAPYLVIDEKIASIPTSFPDGTILASPDRRSAYITYHRALFPRDLDTVEQARVLPDAALSQLLAAGPVDGTILREATIRSTYIVVAGARFPVAEEVLDILGLNAEEALHVCRGGLSHLPVVENSEQALNEWQHAAFLGLDTSGSPLAGPPSIDDVKARLEPLAPIVVQAGDDSPRCQPGKPRIRF
jgi:hypothetical protein